MAPFLATFMETVLNGYLRLDPDAAGRLSFLSGRSIALEVTGPDVTLYLLPGSGGIRVLSELDRDPDVVIRAAPTTLARLARGDATAAGDCEIAGDTHLGREFQALLRTIDIDWEEQLSRFVGDLPARQLGNALRAGGAWGEQVVARLLHNTGEFLQYEHRDLPPRQLVEIFLDEVDRLRADVDRLEARIHRLQRACER